MACGSRARTAGARGCRVIGNYVRGGSAMDWFVETPSPRTLEACNRSFKPPHPESDIDEAANVGFRLVLEGET